MPYKSDQAKIAPTDLLPQHLSHKPVYALPYEQFDCIFRGDTDMRFISVGMAQYDQDEVSLKILRHTGDKWTRQSEELPLHRVVDAATFLAKVLYDSDDGNVALPASTLENQTANLYISREKRSYGELASYNRFLEKNGGLLKERFNKLYEALQQLKDAGKL